MKLPESGRYPLAPDLNLCRLPVGLWQVSGAHGLIDPTAAVQSMVDYLDAGFTTFDLADHYGPAEDFVGQRRRLLASQRGEAALSEMQALTKWVPPPGKVTRAVVEQAIAVSRRRMGSMATLDLLQFHWWDYHDARYLDALRHLADLQSAGQIRHLALTNFDTEHLRIIHDAGIRIVSNQVQYSLVDQRPAQRMAAFCQEHDIVLLTYGTVCGGLLSERYLARPEPGAPALGTASLRKYKNMIDAWGGWSLFQELLQALAEIARKHAVSLTNVAVRAILDRPAVAGVIIGCRLGVSEHREENARVFAMALDDTDRDRIQEVVSRGRDLQQVIGDCGDEYRR